ncbi:MAG: ABC transporter permease [Blautia sp.]|nr:ABC transporter permease [Blautia sp.]MDY3998749.1 ABC transporter permease [Blautia sp.]
MKKFIIRRVLLGALILFFVSLIIYSVERSLPTSYVEGRARDMSMKQGAKPYDELVAELNASYGLDKPVLAGYFSWLGNAVRGDFGESWIWHKPVTEKFKDVIWYSFALALAAFILEIFIAIPLGIISATKQYSKVDYAVTVFALIGISLPTFFFATILKWIFSIHLGWFDLYGIVGRMHETYGAVGKILDMARHLVLPVITLTIVSIGSLMRYTRTNMLEVLNADYIRTARAKGVSEKKVVAHHAFRNTLIPIITILGSTLPGLFSGAMITETLFQIPGIGYTSYQCLISGDIPFTMFYMVFLAMLTLLGNLIADILYAVADPRVRVN